MKTNLKRIGAWALCFMLLLSCIPVSADEGLLTTRDYSAGYSLDGALPTANYDIEATTKIQYNSSTSTWSVPVYYYYVDADDVSRIVDSDFSTYASVSNSGNTVIQPSASKLQSLNGSFKSIKVATGVDTTPVDSSENTLTLSASSDGTTYFKNYYLKYNGMNVGEYTWYGVNKGEYAVFVEFQLNLVKATFNTDGGTEVDPISDVQPGTEIKLPDAPTKEGYTFLGWKVEGDETLYQPSRSYVLSTDTTFTAQWDESFIITFNYNGATDESGKTSLKFTDQKSNDTIVIPDVDNLVYPDENKVFDSWVCDGKYYDPGEEVTVTGNATYTAVWLGEEDYFSVVFEQGEHGYFATMDPEDGGSVDFQIPLNRNIREHLGNQWPMEDSQELTASEGYIFKGWYEQRTGEKLNDSTIVSGDMTFVAQYYQDVKAIIDDTDITLAADYENPISIGPDDSQLMFTLPTRDQVTVAGEGKVLDHWAVDGKDVSYAPGAVVTITATTTFKPVLTNDCWTITFDAGKGSNPPAPIYVAKGDSFTFPAQGSMTYTSGLTTYALVGWSTTSNASTAQYLPGDSAIPSANTTYYAVWTQGYTVTFDGGNEGSGSYTLAVQQGSTFTFPEPSEIGITPNDPSYTFIGWSTTTTGKDNCYIAGIESPTVSGATTYYAMWLTGEEASTDILAYFYIRIDGEIQYEPASYGKANYYPLSSGKDLQGYLNEAKAVNNNLGAVKANIKKEPETAAIQNVLTSNGVSFDPAKQEIVWYVIKTRDGAGTYDGKWNVDGVIRDKNKFSVEYHPNGGSTNVPGSVQYTAGYTVTVSYEKIPTRTGYTFLGWSEDPQATTPTYTQTGNNTFKMPEENVHLYAVWKPDTSTPYMVEFYYSNEDGSYNSTAYDSVTRYGTTGTYAIVTNADKVPQINGYELDEDAVGKLYTGQINSNGSLVLKVYFKYTGAPYRSIQVKKEWKEPVAAMTHGEVTITLLRDGVETSNTLKLNEQNQWSGSFEHLPYYSPQGTLYQYTVTENAVAGYKTSITPTSVNASTYTVTNTLTNKDVVVTKNWVDSSNAYGTRPAAITLKLKNGSTVAETKTVTPDATAVSQTVTFTVPAYNSDGTVATYTVEEDGVNGYTTSVDGLTVTNTLKTYSLIVEKQIAGNMADSQKDFTFTAKLLKPKSSTGDNGQPVQEYVDSGLYVTKDGLTNATSSFTLKANQSITLTGIPYGYKVEVTETGTPGYKAKTEQGGVTSGETGVGLSCTDEVGPFTYTGSNNAKITFINTNNATIDTGVTLDFLPYVLLILGVGIAVALWLVMSANKRKDD